MEGGSGTRGIVWVSHIPSDAYCMFRLVVSMKAGIELVRGWLMPRPPLLVDILLRRSEC